jgi:hypothetical protein
MKPCIWRVPVLVMVSAVLVMAGLGVIAASATAFMPHGTQVKAERVSAVRQPYQAAVAPGRPVDPAEMDRGRLARPAPDLKAVVGNITNWLVGMLVSLATLFLTIGGLRYLFAGGDPSEVGKAKDTLKYAGIGYCVAILAPVLVKILQGFVGAG